MKSEPCRNKCAQFGRKGVRATYWCGFLSKSKEKDHKEHDYLYKGEWFHCYG